MMSKSSADHLKDSSKLYEEPPERARREEVCAIPTSRESGVFHLLLVPDCFPFERRNSEAATTTAGIAKLRGPKACTI